MKPSGGWAFIGIPCIGPFICIAHEAALLIGGALLVLKGLLALKALLAIVCSL